MVIGCPFALRNYHLLFLVDLLVLLLASVQAKFSPAIRVLSPYFFCICSLVTAFG
jgi:hypothetical protein